MKRESTLRLWFLVVLLFLSSTVLHEFTTQVSGPRYLAPPPEYIEYFHFGFRESMADSFWLRWIQDNGECQTYQGMHAAHPLLPFEDFYNTRHKFCDNSWAFKMLDAVTKLAPRFLMPYVTGAISLSVLVEDYEGAKVIFDRGLQNYPDDWQLAYEAAYHYLFDRHELPRAAELLIQAQKNGGPPWLALLAARLYTKTGQLEIGISTLENYRRTLKDERQIKDVDNRIADLKKQLSP